MRERLLAGDRAVVQALQGTGGVGKTQLAIEYARRFAKAYDVAWWVDAEQPALVEDQFAVLGAALGCVQSGADTETVRAAVLADLHQRGRWLLVFDNAENLGVVAGWLPFKAGHVLIMSADYLPDAGLGLDRGPVEVDVLARDESVALLRGRVAELGGADADRLADQLGDLPLGVAGAAGSMTETGTPAAQYLGATGDPCRAAAGPASAWVVLFAVAGCRDPAACGPARPGISGRAPAGQHVARSCPESIPDNLFTGAAGELPGELAFRAANPVAWRQVLARLARQSLARIDQRRLAMVRLTQAILRDRLTAEQAAATRARRRSWPLLTGDGTIR